jgi:hypothetical protein
MSNVIYPDHRSDGAPRYERRSGADVKDGLSALTGSPDGRRGAGSGEYITKLGVGVEL